MNGLTIQWVRSHHLGTCVGCHEGSCNAAFHCPCEGCDCTTSPNIDTPKEGS